MSLKITTHASSNVEAPDDDRGSESRERGAESAGDVRGGGRWQVFNTAEGHVVVVTLGPGARSKRRLPKSLATLEDRSKFARMAAPDIKAKMLEDAKRKAEDAAPKQDPTKLTFGDFADLWTNGTLAQLHPDVVEMKRSVETDKARLGVIKKLIGHVPLDQIGIEHANKVVQNLPPRAKSKASLRHYKQLLFHVMKLAAKPEIGKIARSPFGEGFIPKILPKDRKALNWVYPDEEEQLCGCADVPLHRRVLYALLAREGMRSGEAYALRWQDVDLVRGVVSVDDSKTGDKRSWALGADVVRALKAWKKLHPEATYEDRVFVDDTGVTFESERGAQVFRADLKLAGVKRPQLFEKSDRRLPVRVHDQRASFITLALATGRSEAWVMERTGHTTSGMLARYRREKSMAQQIGLAWFSRMDRAIPELADEDDDGTSPSGSRGPRAEQNRSDDVPDSGGSSATIRDGSSASATTTNEGASQKDENPRDRRPRLGSTAERRRGSSPLPCTSATLPPSVVTSASSGR